MTVKVTKAAKAATKTLTMPAIIVDTLRAIAMVETGGELPAYFGQRALELVQTSPFNDEWKAKRTEEIEKALKG